MHHRKQQWSCAFSAVVACIVALQQPMLISAVQSNGLLLSRQFLQRNSTGSPGPYPYRTEYFETFIDHFGFASDAKFKIKYLINEDHYEPGGAILFYTGNEGLIEGFADNTGLMWELAPRLRATVIFMEHRYYGSSMPFTDPNWFKNRTLFAYFTAEQALADFALFLHELKQNDFRYKHAPVISFGGSYGGMLTSWFRAKYPNLVAGAIAASAPIFGFPNMTDCNAFYATLTRAFEMSGSERCVAGIRASWEVLAGADPAKLTRVFKLCRPLQLSQQLADYLSEFYGEIGMVNYPYPATFLGQYPAWPVKEFCRPLTDAYDKSTTTDDQLLTMLAQGIMADKNYSKTLTCLDLGEGSGTVDASGWDLQTCMEMQLPMCSDGQADMFPVQAYSVDEVEARCAELFDGVKPRFTWPEVQFWGKDLPTNFDRIIFSNGNLDPWSGMGVLHGEQAYGAVVLRIPNGAHHLDLRASDPRDPADVTFARDKEISLIESWIAQFYLNLYLISPYSQ